jgi:hypothetical protein
MAVARQPLLGLALTLIAHFDVVKRPVNRFAENLPVMSNEAILPVNLPSSLTVPSIVPLNCPVVCPLT